jgi:hypothetical protein
LQRRHRRWTSQTLLADRRAAAFHRCASGRHEHSRTHHRMPASGRRNGRKDALETPGAGTHPRAHADERARALVDPALLSGTRAQRRPDWCHGDGDSWELVERRLREGKVGETEGAFRHM